MDSPSVPFSIILVVFVLNFSPIETVLQKMERDRAALDIFYLGIPRCPISVPSCNLGRH